ncbi:uncharacterized protein CIMG_11022 [Coccidioides immitis RS]|uniref:Uncharacterized protein n=1 Tax=Coccidioides immitis (strain RS) TaxID=246410 RepID=A0A0D8JS34_COCIM|nr:uncharacterized protein CIMG_11022 [Coccidioides immitis RS]KJF59944.1 hypothetical protein CIMG_11022 [Coccidioides immitis RS]
MSPLPFGPAQFHGTKSVPASRSPGTRLGFDFGFVGREGNYLSSFAESEADRYYQGNTEEERKIKWREKAVGRGGITAHFQFVNHHDGKRKMHEQYVLISGIPGSIKHESTLYIRKRSYRRGKRRGREKGEPNVVMRLSELVSPYLEPPIAHPQPHLSAPSSP